MRRSFSSVRAALAGLGNVVLACVVLAYVVLAGSGPAHADPPSDFRGGGLAPYRFNPPPQTLSPAEEGAARAYRSDLQRQQKELELRKFDAGPVERQQLRDTTRELGRMERLLNQR